MDEKIATRLRRDGGAPKMNRVSSAMLQVLDGRFGSILQLQVEERCWSENEFGYFGAVDASGVRFLQGLTTTHITSEMIHGESGEHGQQADPNIKSLSKHHTHRSKTLPLRHAGCFRLVSDSAGAGVLA